jgi:hypothetical protein
MKTIEVATLLGVTDKHVRKYKGQFRYHKSYYYRHGLTPETLVNNVKEKIPTAVITDQGDHQHVFVGGAETGSAKDSFVWVTFKV